jgi:hypothetical protein
MRLMTWTILLIAASCVAPARAQTYGGGAPFCIHTYGYSGNNIECNFGSIEQCRAAATGISATCGINPYYAAAAAAPARRRSRDY